MTLEKLYLKIMAFTTNFVNTCISIFKIIIQSSFSAKLPASDQNTCIILGNGPSLSESLSKHYAFFKKHSLICVNQFVLSKEYVALKPAYYVMLDPILWQGETNPDIKRIFDTLIETTTWELNLLVPWKARGSFSLKQILSSNPKIKISYFNYTVFRGFPGVSHFFFRRNLAMPQSQNVLVASIFLSINMHFKKIVIVGADHTWHENLHVNESNQLCIKDVHFYDDERVVNYRLFYKDVRQTETFLMHEILFTFGKAFYGYQVLKHYAAAEGVIIYNASERSFIDAFERKKIADLSLQPS